MTKKNMKAYALIIIALLVVAICVGIAVRHRDSKSTLSAEGVTGTVSEITKDTSNTKEKYSVPPIILTEGPKETAEPADTQVVTDEEGTTKYVQQNVPQDVTDVYVTDKPEETPQTTAVTTQPKPVKTNSLGLPVTAPNGTVMVGNDGNTYGYQTLFGKWVKQGDGGGAQTMSPEEREEYENTPDGYID